MRGIFVTSQHLLHRIGLSDAAPASGFFLCPAPFDLAHRTLNGVPMPLAAFPVRRNVVPSRMMVAMWRMAQPADDDSLVEMCLQLYREDPGLSPVPEDHIRATLAALRREPYRGRAVALEVQQQPSGYALLIAFWSNELGGEVCHVDEVFVLPQQRDKGYGKSLFAAIARGELWPSPVVAITLGVTPDNSRARRLYERLGFTAVGVSMVCRTPESARSKE